MQANPADPAPRQALLQFLIDQNRFDEAFSLTEASLKYTPKDANLLVDRGFLALQRGHADQALASWNQALAVDPEPVAGASVSGATNWIAKARRRPRPRTTTRFSKRSRGSRAQDRPAPDQVIAIVLRMADCQARSSQTGLAVKSYHLAEKLAAQTRQTKLESVADVNEAALQAKAGKLDDALQLYQHALQLDTSIGDNSASAAGLVRLRPLSGRCGISGAAGLCLHGEIGDS